MGDFYYELAVKVAEICFASRSRNGGIIAVTEVHEILNRKKKSYTLNGSRYKAYKYVSLKAGTYSVHAQTQFRLCLIPEKIEEFLDPKFKKEGKLFHKAYDY